MAKKGKSSVSHVLGTILGVILTICLIPLILVNGLLIKSHLTYKDGPPRVQGRAVFLSTEKIKGKAEKGSLIVTVPSKDGKYKKGEYIAFKNPMTSDIAVMKVVAERHSVDDGSVLYEMEKTEKGELVFVTKDEVIGICDFRLAPAGEVVAFLNTGIGIIISVLIPLLWFILATKSKGKSKKEIEELNNPKEPGIDFNLDEEPPIRLGQHSNPNKWNLPLEDTELVQGRVLKPNIPDYTEPKKKDPYENQLEECREMFEKADKLEEKKPSSLKLDPEKVKEAHKEVRKVEEEDSFKKDELPEPLKPEPKVEEKPEPKVEIKKSVIEEPSTVEDDFLAAHRETIRMLEELKAAEEAHLERIRREKTELPMNSEEDESMRPSKRKRNGEVGTPVKVKPRRVYGYSKRGAGNETEK